MKNTLKTILEAVKIAIGKISWNDLKDRPFYESEPKETVLFEDVLTIEDWYDGASFTIEEYGKYVVEINGETYTLEARRGSSNSVFIGNPVIWGEYLEKDNDIPFAIGCGDVGDTWIGVATSGEYSLKITAYIAKVHKLHEKYLPFEKSLATPIIDIDQFEVITSLGINTNGVFEKYDENLGYFYRKAYKLIKWGSINDAMFYDMANGIRYYCWIDLPSEYSNNYECIRIESNGIYVDFNGIHDMSMGYTWYIDDDGIVWGNCRYIDNIVQLNQQSDEG